MNRVVTAMICIIVITAAIFTALILVNYNKSNSGQPTQITELSQTNDLITDECTEEYEQIQSAQTLQANSDEQKISPNCTIKLQKYYTKCGHTTNEYIDLDTDLINKGETELQEKYPNWQIEKYTPTEIILTKTFQGECRTTLQYNSKRWKNSSK